MCKTESFLNIPFLPKAQYSATVSNNNKKKAWEDVVELFNSLSPQIQGHRTHFRISV